MDSANGNMESECEAWNQVAYDAEDEVGCTGPEKKLKIAPAAHTGNTSDQIEDFGTVDFVQVPGPSSESDPRGVDRTVRNVTPNPMQGGAGADPMICSPRCAANEEEEVEAQVDKGSHTTTMADLSWEVKLMIFRYLPQEDKLKNTPLVNWEWYNLSYNQNIWRELKVSGGGMSTEKAITLVQRMPQLRRVKLDSFMRGVDDLLTVVADNCPNLDELKLKTVTILHDKTLDLVAEKCPELQVLEFYACCHPRASRSLIEVFSPCSKLHTISVMNCNSMKPTGMLDSSSYSNLKEVTYYRRPCDSEIRALIGRAGKQLRKIEALELHKQHSYLLLAQCQQLEELHLGSAYQMTDECLLHGVGALNNLHHLTISGAHSLTQGALLSFFSRRDVVGRLTYLDMFGAKGLDDSCIDAIAATCPLLAYLNLQCTRATSQSLPNLVKCCVNLEQLAVYGLWGMQMTESELDNLHELRPGLQISYIDS